MSVVGDRKVVFCEGRQSSLDYRLLDVIVNNLPESPTIVPARSKFTFSVFAQGYFFPDEATNQRYIIFRDRDFDTRPTPDIKLLHLETRLGGKNVILTHRTCVENYLIEADLIHAYWVAKYKEKQENRMSRWGHADSPGIAIISTWIENGAKYIQDYQAVRWALADLIPGEYAHLKTTWTGESGRLPASLDLNDCQSEALQLIAQFKQNVSLVTPENFKLNLNKYRIQFSQTDFWQQRQYLIWFHGKDLQKAMQRLEPHYISLETFFESIIPQLDITRYPDLVELRKKIQQL
ncbi:MAG: hypothetical protein HC875_03080 [Anaerolineales bacterium]|nr:hypothetical protein [Anaerolineales bacterium]